MTRSRKLRALTFLLACAAFAAAHLLVRQIDLPPMHWAGE